MIFPENQCSIMSAKSKGIRQGNPDIGLPADVENIIQIQVRVGLLEVDGGGQQIVFDAQCGNDPFDDTGSTHRMAEH